MDSLLPRFLYLDVTKDLGTALPGTYNWMLVALSVMIASLAAYAALVGAGRISAAKTSLAKYAWLATGAVAMGIGIWAMHFIGMLAFTLPVEVRYDLPITVASIAPAILASGIVLYLISQEQIGIRRLILGGILMGAGIGLMHYTGMMAMRMYASMFFDPVMFFVSILVAVALSIAALYTKFLATNDTQSLVHWTNFAAALVMGFAVAGMHYTGMSAAYFFPGEGTWVREYLEGETLDPVTLGVWVGLATGMIIGVAILFFVVDRRMDAAGQHFMSQTPTDNIAKTIRSVSRSFNFAMLAVVSVLLFCFAIVAIIVTVKLSEQELEQKLTNSINVAKTSLSQALWNLDEKIVTDFINSVLLDESFVYAAVLWEKQIVAEKKRAWIKALSAEEIERSDEFITKSDVIQFEGKDIGKFVVAISRDSILLKIFLNALGSFGLAICVVAGVSATSLFVTRKYISQPLLKLNLSASKIAQGDLEAPIELNRQDEFGLLAQNFDAMRGSIRTLVGELRENNRTLEERVDQRTSEAAEATQAAEEARRRLLDALESTHEGFLLCDAEDRLVLANPRYLEMYPGIADLVVPGTPYQTILRALVDRKLIGSDNQDPESWFERRINFHRDPKGAHLYRLQDGRWVQVTERRTDAGGTVSVFADITDLKDSEQRAATANDLITQSLRYASRIQAAILPAQEELASVTADHFLIWEPRDIVGGDFFWFQKIPNGYALIVGDCTGHGVPGAFMTLVTWGLLDRMLQAASTDKPSQVLSGLHEGVQALLGQHRQDGETDDGLEAGICFVNEETRELFFSGARFSLWHANGKAVQEIKGDRAALGYRRYPSKTVFNDVSLKIADGSAFYMTTDGLIDQIGGPRGRAFGKNRFKSFVQRNVDQAMVKQSESLSKALVRYQGKEIRRDDLTVLGFVP